MVVAYRLNFWFPVGASDCAGRDWPCRNSLRIKGVRKGCPDNSLRLRRVRGRDDIIEGACSQSIQIRVPVESASKYDHRCARLCFSHFSEHRSKIAVNQSFFAVSTNRNCS